MNAIRYTQQKLTEAGYQSEQLFYDACALAQKVTGLPIAHILGSDSLLTTEQEHELATLIRELVQLHKPLQYILGSVPFCSLDIVVCPPLLIPRPETEEWVANLINTLDSKNNFDILDIGTGTGCIALALAHALPNAHIVGADSSAEAINLARENQTRNNIINTTFILSNVFEKIKNTFDIIVSNPPYIAQECWEKLPPHIKDWEDKKALVCAEDGLFLLKQIIKKSPKYCKKTGGTLVLEIGYDQAPAVCTFMQSCGYTDIQVKKDFAHHDRVVMGRYGC